MSNGEHVTRAELASELRSLRLEMRLLIVGCILVLKLDFPNEITIPAVSALAAKAVWGLVVGHYG